VLYFYIALFLSVPDDLRSTKSLYCRPPSNFTTLGTRTGKKPQKSKGKKRKHSSSGVQESSLAKVPSFCDVKGLEVMNAHDGIYK